MGENESELYKTTSGPDPNRWQEWLESKERGLYNEGHNTPKQDAAVDPLYHYVRVIDESNSLDLNNLLAVLDSLSRANPKVSIRKPPEPHPRGGFSLFLNSPNSEADMVLDYLRNHGWLPCI